MAIGIAGVFLLHIPIGLVVTFFPFSHHMWMILPFFNPVFTLVMFYWAIFKVKPACKPRSIRQQKFFNLCVIGIVVIVLLSMIGILPLGQMNGKCEITSASKFYSLNGTAEIVPDGASAYTMTSSQECVLSCTGGNPIENPTTCKFTPLIGQGWEISSDETALDGNS